MKPHPENPKRRRKAKLCRIADREQNQKSFKEDFFYKTASIIYGIYFSTINQQFTTILRFFVVLLCHPASGSQGDGHKSKLGYQVHVTYSIDQHLIYCNAFEFVCDVQRPSVHHNRKVHYKN